MEAQLAIAGFVGLVVGWNARGFFPEKEEAPACSCLCNCHHNVTSSEAASWFQPGLVVASLVVLITIAANLALVFRVSWVTKESLLLLLATRKDRRVRAVVPLDLPKVYKFKDDGCPCS